MMKLTREYIFLNQFCAAKNRNEGNIMDRLTKVYKNGMITLDAQKFDVSQEAIDSVIRNCEAIRTAIEKLKTYEDSITEINPL